MKKKIVFAAVLTVTLVAQPGSAAEKRDFLKDMTSLRDRALDHFDPAQCKERLESLNQEFGKISFQNYDRKSLVEHTPEVINILWSLQVSLHNPLERYPSACIPILRDSFYAIRSMIDYVGTLGYVTAVGGHHLRGEDIDWQKRPVPLLNEEFYHGYLKGPAATSNLKFQPGDIFMTRGFTSAPSALITQTVEHRTHYSHVVFVHVTPNGQEMTLESYAGTGLQKYDMDYALKNENPRIMLMRPKDAELGRAAGEFMYGVVNQSVKDGKKVQFDYYTDTLHHDHVWCGEVAYWAYDEASNHKVLLPQYKNAIHWNNLGFLKAFRIKNGEAYQASDIEVDPRFDIVLEHRDWELIQDNRYKDAILREILRWQDEYGYTFHGKLRTALIDTIYELRKTPLWPTLKKAGLPDIPSDASKDIVLTFDRLKRLTPPIYEMLAQADKEHQAATGWPMTNSELTEAVQKIREKDLATALLNGPKKSKFHGLYRPNLK